MMIEECDKSNNPFKFLLVVISITLLQLSGFSTAQDLKNISVDHLDSKKQTSLELYTTAQEAYNVTWGAFKILYDNKVKDDGKLIVDKETYDKGFKLATAYYEAWGLWIDAVMKYDIGATGQETIEEKAAAFSDVSLQLMNFLNRYVLD